MTTLPRIVALVPMRHHSERIPGKNFRDLAGKPLYSYILEKLLACPEISEVVVDTDSPAIMEGIPRRFPTVRILERPETLRADDVPMNEVLGYDVGEIQSDFYLQTHSTNPLLRQETISVAVREFTRSYPAHDSLFSVTRWQTRLWDQHFQPVNHDPSVLIRTQDLPPIYEENSCIYLFEGAAFRRRRNRIGERPLLFEIDPFEAWDIDEPFDWSVAELLLSQRADESVRRAPRGVG